MRWLVLVPVLAGCVSHPGADGAGALRRLAFEWHREAFRTKEQRAYDLAEHYYKAYFAEFPADRKASTVTYYYAELLEKMGSLGAPRRYCDAAPLYARVVRMEPEGLHLKDAAYAAVLARKNCLATEGGAENDPPGVAGEVHRAEKAITANDSKMIEAYDEYIAHVHEAPELVTIKYRKARIYYLAKHFDEASKLFADIAEHYRSDVLAIYSAMLLIDCLDAKKDHDGVARYVDEFLATPDFQTNQGFSQKLGVIKKDLDRKRAR